MRPTVTPIFSKKSVVAIAAVLLEGPQTPVAIAASLGYTQGHVSNRLALLKSHGFVYVTPSGRNRMYELSKEGALRIRQTMAEPSCGALRSLVEEHIQDDPA